MQTHPAQPTTPSLDRRFSVPATESAPTPEPIVEPSLDRESPAPATDDDSTPEPTVKVASPAGAPSSPIIKPAIAQPNDPTGAENQAAPPSFIASGSNVDMVAPGGNEDIDAGSPGAHPPGEEPSGDNAGGTPPRRARASEDLVSAGSLLQYLADRIQGTPGPNATPPINPPPLLVPQDDPEQVSPFLSIWYMSTKQPLAQTGPAPIGKRLLSNRLPAC